MENDAITLWRLNQIKAAIAIIFYSKLLITPYVAFIDNSPDEKLSVIKTEEINDIKIVKGVWSFFDRVVALFKLILS